MEWYIVYRYNFANSGAAMREVVDGVYCTHADQALRISLARLSVQPGDEFRAWRCESPREIKTAKKMERRIRIRIESTFDIDLWPNREFVEFMQMPTYEGSHQ